MKKNNLKKILVVFSLCVFLLSMFSVSSFALNISDVHTGYLYEFTGSLPPSSSLLLSGTINVSGYVVDKSSGAMTSFDTLYFTRVDASASSGSGSFWALSSVSSTPSDANIFSASLGNRGKIYIDFADNSMSRSEFETLLDRRWTYTVTSLDSVESMFDKANIALVGGTNGDGDTYDGLLGMISKFGKFLVSSPLLLVLCVALPLVSFSVGLIIRIKNRA